MTNATNTNAARQYEALDIERAMNAQGKVFTISHHAFDTKLSVKGWEILDVTNDFNTGETEVQYVNNVNGQPQGVTLRYGVSHGFGYIAIGEDRIGFTTAGDFSINDFNRLRKTFADVL